MQTHAKLFHFKEGRLVNVIAPVWETWLETFILPNKEIGTAEIDRAELFFQFSDSGGVSD